MRFQRRHFWEAQGRLGLGRAGGLRALVLGGGSARLALPWAVPWVLLPWSGCAGRGPTLHPSSGSSLSSLCPGRGWQCRWS